MNVLMGIGNRLNGDDGIGPWIAHHLIHDNWKTIDCGTVPENFTGQLKKYNPELLVLVDAADMNLHPGEIRQIPSTKIDTYHPSTHALPLTLLLTHLAETIETIIAIGIQPKKLIGGLTPEVRAAGKNLIKIIKKNNINAIKSL